MRDGDHYKEISENNIGAVLKQLITLFDDLRPFLEKVFILEDVPYAS